MNMTIDGLISLPGDLYAWAVGYNPESVDDPRAFDLSVAMRITAVAAVALAAVAASFTTMIPVINLLTFFAATGISLYAHDFFVCGESLKSDKDSSFLFCKALGIEEPVLRSVGPIAKFISDNVLLQQR